MDASRLMASALACAFDAVAFSSPSMPPPDTTRRDSHSEAGSRRYAASVQLEGALRMSSRPFHYSFAVTDLASTRAFYRELLGCGEGRSTDTWVDFDFYGNQISAHLGSSAAPAATGQVDGIAVPIPHFGALLGWED